jgi:hypothetical protein
MNAVAINSIKSCCAFFNNIFSNLQVKRQVLLILTFLFFSVFSIQAQTYCEDIPGRDCDDCPSFPVSNNPDLGVSCQETIDVILILDESNSIGNANAENQVRDGVLAFLQELECTPVNVAIIEFGSVANYVVSSYTPVSNVVAGMTNYFAGTSYNGQTYNPDQGNLGGTNWQAALLRANALPTADLLLMFTDGQPTTYSPNANNPGSSYDFCDSGTTTEEAEIYNAAILANIIKGKGTHMFVLGVGNAVAGEIPNITGSDVYNSNINTIANSDYEIDANINNVAACFRNLAKSLCPIIVDIQGTTICENATNGVIDVTLSTLANGPFTVTVTQVGNPVDSFVTNLKDFSVSNLPAGTYTVTVEADQDCYSEGSKNITINTSIPIAVINGPLEIDCIDDTVTLDGTGSTASGVSYLWTTNDGSFSGPVNQITATATSIGTYTLTVTDTEANCTATEDIEVTTNVSAPTADAGPDAELACATLEAILDGSGSSTNPEADLSYSWSGPNGYSATTEDITVTEVGTYTLTVTDNDNGCTAMSSAEVTEDTIPPVLDNPDTILDINCNDSLPTQQILTATDDNGVNVTPSIDPYTVDVCNGYAVTYRWTATDDCNNSSEKTVTFNVLPSPDMVLNDVADESYASCDYASQGELDLVFQAFLDKFGYTGGCDASGQLASFYSAPDLCSGGTVNVTYNVTDLCENASETASFTITPSEALEVSCPTGVSLDASSTQQEIQDAYDAWKLEFTKTGGCNATDNLDTFPSLPSFDCDTRIDLTFDYVATDRCYQNGISCSSTFSVEGREPVDAGENGELTICENGMVTAEELFEALGGNPDEGGTWSPELGGANVYTYTVQGTDPCPDATATVTVDELNLEILASEPVCDEEIGTYSVNVQVSEGMVSSTLGTPVDNGGGSWTIIDIPTDNDIVVTTTTTVSNNVECTNSVNIISPDCICIELDLKYTDVTCFGLDDGTITVEFVTEGATVTVNGQPYNPDMLYVPGTYTVTAYFEGNDDDNCIISEEITIVEPAVVDIQVSSTNVTCYGEADGTITIESLSEGAFYTIKLNGIGPDLSGQEYFAPGVYFVEARLISNATSRMSAEGKGDVSLRVEDPCVDAKLIVIEQPDQLICKIGKSYSGNEIRCNDRTNNSLTVNQLGGVGPYTYSWSMDKSAYYGVWEIIDGAESQTMTYIPGMQSGTFTVEVTDANGCSTICEITLESTCTKADYYNYFSRQNDFDFEMFPNPTNGKLTVKPNKLSNSQATVELYDLIGTRIFSQSFDKIKDNEININLTNLSSQVYYLKVITKDGTKIKKVVLDK